MEKLIPARSALVTAALIKKLSTAFGSGSV